MDHTIRECIIESAQLNSILFDHPDATHVKVHLIKEELHLGRYRVHSTNIAHKMLDLPQTKLTNCWHIPA